MRSSSANFVATINAELSVGALTETVVVTGETPLVDARSVAKGAVISQATLTALPTSKSVGSMLAFVPGAVSPTNGVDTGGTKGEQSVRISVFGARPNDMRRRGAAARFAIQAGRMASGSAARRMGR